MWVRKIFITKSGSIVILQRPNLPIVAWLITKILEHITREPVIKERPRSNERGLSFDLVSSGIIPGSKLFSQNTWTTNLT